MITNYFKIAWRNIKKQRLNTFINGIGLLSAFVFMMLIASFIWHETHVDKHIKNVHRQYILQSELNNLTTSGMLAKALHEEYPDIVENYFRFDGITAIVSVNNNHFQQSAIIADSTFFDMFGFTLKHGNPSLALSDPFQTVITEETAIRYFGMTNAVGKTIEVANFNGEKKDFTVSGVLAQIPQNSVTHFISEDPMDMIFPLQNVTFFNRSIDSWMNPYIASYVTLKEGLDQSVLKLPIHTLIRKHIPQDQQKSFTTKALPLQSYHLAKNNGMMMKMVTTLWIIGACIMLMACINFINISIHSATRRLREIGIRKLLGGHSGQIRLQFLSETVLLVFIIMLINILLYPLTSKIGASLFGKQLTLLTEFDLTFWLLVIGIHLSIGIIAGIYPAIRLSSYKTLQSIKGKLTTSFEKTLLLKGLVGVQFILAMVVLISAIVIIRQVSVLFGENMGYDKDYLITTQVPRDWSEQGLTHTAMQRNLLADKPEIESISLSYDIPGTMGSGSVQIKGKESAISHISANMIFSDRHFSETYKIPLLAGSFYSVEESAELLNHIVINLSLSKSLGYQQAEDAINKTIYFEGNSEPFIIAGVCQDFFSGSMNMPVGNILWINVKNSNTYRFFTIRLKPNNIPESLKKLSDYWTTLFPSAPFEYTFVDDKIKQLYKTELQLRDATFASAAISILIVFIGLIGLILENLSRRVKEIGIRKVLGASRKQIMGLFVKDIGIIFLISAGVATPVGYVLINQWLQNYYVQTTLDCVTIGLPIVALALLTTTLIWALTRRPAKANPVNSLRDE